MKKTLLTLPLMAMLMMASCSDDDTTSDNRTQPGGTQTSTTLKGMYVLNEGNWGANKASVDYLDLSSTPVGYTTDLWAQRNPSVVMGLGDMGSDMKIYGSKLWIVVNGSNKVEIADAATCQRLGVVDVPNGRFVAFSGAHAYVTSYTGTSMQDGNASPGSVYKIDTTTMKTVARIDVGLQPEEIDVVGDRIYVANSGGYSAPDYDRTVSVIDINTFKEIEKIDVAINLLRLKADNDGKLWVTSQGDYGATPAKFYVLNKDKDGKMRVQKTIDKTPISFCIVGDSLYYYTSEWSYITSSYAVNYGIINTKTCEEVASTLFKTPADAAHIMMPYGIIVCPGTNEAYPGKHDFFIMDAMDYTSSGKVHHFNADGTLNRSYNAGDLPGPAAFVMK